MHLVVSQGLQGHVRAGTLTCLASYSGVSCLLHHGSCLSPSPHQHSWKQATIAPTLKGRGTKRLPGGPGAPGFVDVLAQQE